MHRILLQITLLLCVGSGLIATEGGVRATMRVRGNIRFGPSTEALVVVTLDPGTPVRVLGEVDGRAGWYEIAFPEQGGAWIHERNIEVVGDGRRVRVTADIANIRSDSRVQGELVAQVREGEVLRWHGREEAGRWQGIAQGAWHKIHPARAVAYAFESVLNFEDGQQRTASTTRLPQDRRVDTIWQDALDLYERYRQALERDPQGALSLDWAELARRLQAVVDEHPEFRTRLVADDLRSRIGRVVWIAERHQREQDIRPRLEIPELTGTAPNDTQTQPTSQRQERIIARVSPPSDTPSTPPPTTHQEPEPLRLDPAPLPPQEEPETKPKLITQPEPDDSEPDDPPATESPAHSPPKEVPQLPAVATDRYQALGWLQSRDINGSNARHVIIDRNNDIEALVMVAEGSDINLSDFHWRRVGVQGDTSNVTVTIDGLEMTVPLISATTMQLAQ